MATVILTSGEKALKFDISQALYRKINVPVGSTEIRVSITPFVTPGDGGTEQYSPALAGECLRMGFTDGNSLVSGSNYTITGVGCATGGTSNITLLGDGAKLFQNVVSVWDFNTLPVTRTISGGDVGGSQFGIMAATDRSSIYTFRLFKSGSLDLYFEFRTASGYSIGAGFPISDTTMKIYCNNYASYTNIQRQDKFAFTSEVDRDLAFTRLNTFFFGWPFTTYKGHIGGMAYKVI
jgi:hypothetical protein